MSYDESITSRRNSSQVYVRGGEVAMAVTLTLSADDMLTGVSELSLSDTLSPGVGGEFLLTVS